MAYTIPERKAPTLLGGRNTAPSEPRTLSVDPNQDFTIPNAGPRTLAQRPPAPSEPRTMNPAVANDFVIPQVDPTARLRKRQRHIAPPALMRGAQGRGPAPWAESVAQGGRLPPPMAARRRGMPAQPKRGRSRFGRDWMDSLMQKKQKREARNQMFNRFMQGF